MAIGEGGQDRANGDDMREKYVIVGGKWIFILSVFWFCMGIWFGYRIGYVFYEPKTITEVITDYCMKQCCLFKTQRIKAIV